MVIIVLFSPLCNYIEFGSGKLNLHVYGFTSAVIIYAISQVSCSTSWMIVFSR